MTDRLYYTDARVSTFEATVVERSADGTRVYLDRTAFYPTSGGQPHDVGKLGGSDVVDVVDEGERIAHMVSAPVRGDRVTGTIDWARRYDFMRQHTGQHLLSAILADEHHRPTVSVHFGDLTSTVDVAGDVSAGKMAAIEARANELVAAARPIAVSFEDAATATGLRKASDRAGTLRIVTIEGLDRSACGGTHVSSTAEIGPVLLGRSEVVREGTRIEFVCGSRALARARGDRAALQRLASQLSCSIDELPGVIDLTSQRLRDGDASRKKLASELAVYRAREAWARATPDDTGLRRVLETVTDAADDTRAMAIAIAQLPRVLYIATNESARTVMVASSEDSGIDAGQRLKAALTAAGGKGGGSPRLAQGTAPTAGALHLVVATISGHV